VQQEQQLVERMLRGEERAFSEFFDEFFPRLYRFALPRVGGDVDAAQEVVQGTMVKAMQKLDSFRGEASLFTWVCQICRHQAADFIRASQRRTDRVVLIEDTPGVRAALDSISAPDEESPTALYRSEELRRLIQSIVDRLPARYGDALEWKYVEGLSVDEIAQRLELGTTAAQSLLARARGAFREAVTKVFDTEELAELLGSLEPEGEAS
jgi:RNA polymerase sigma-70 factor (ECF subfamily)